MGVCCESKHLSSNDLIDLPRPAVDKKDKLAAWEQGETPFPCVSMAAYVARLDLAAGEEGKVPVSALQANLNTPAWKDLKKINSKLSLWLKQHCLHENGEDFDYNKLMVVGLLHCQDKAKPVSKANYLYNLLQEGGVEKHTHISAKDKDFEIVYNTIFKIVTEAALDGAEQTALYDDAEKEKIQEAMQMVFGLGDFEEEEGSFTDSTFGVQSKISYEVFLEQVAKDGKWIFNPKLLRQKLFAAAEVEIKHIQKA